MGTDKKHCWWESCVGGQKIFSKASQQGNRKPERGMKPNIVHTPRDGQGGIDPEQSR